MAAFDSTTTPVHTAGPERTGLDSEWCAVRASDALRWLADNYPECSGSEALHPHQDAAHEAAVAGDEAAYLEALRSYMRVGRSVALEIRSRTRKGAA
jgi:hypothetical protein